MSRHFFFCLLSVVLKIMFTPDTTIHRTRLCTRTTQPICPPYSPGSLRDRSWIHDYRHQNVGGRPGALLQSKTPAFWPKMKTQPNRVTSRCVPSSKPSGDPVRRTGFELTKQAIRYKTPQQNRYHTRLKFVIFVPKRWRADL